MITLLGNILPKELFVGKIFVISCSFAKIRNEGTTSYWLWKIFS